MFKLVDYDHEPTTLDRVYPGEIAHYSKYVPASATRRAYFECGHIVCTMEGFRRLEPSPSEQTAERKVTEILSESDLADSDLWIIQSTLPGRLSRFLHRIELSL